MHGIKIINVGLSLCLAAALTVAAPAAAAPVGVIDEYGSGISPSAYPADIAAGPDGAMWFTEYAGNRIGRIDPSTGAITEYGGMTAEARPRGITAGPDGNLWFTEFNAGKIGRITPSGAITEYAGLTGALPWDITSGPDGRIWFTEGWGSKVGRLDPTTGALTEFTLAVQPLSITAGPDGNLWSGLSAGIARITPSGVVTVFPTGLHAVDLAAGPDGTIWAADHDAKIGHIFPNTGAVTVFPLPDGRGPEGIAAGQDGTLWFTEYDPPGRIGRLTTAGALTEYEMNLDPNGGPFGIAAGPDGNLWFTEANGNRIGRITTGMPAASLAAPTVSGSLKSGEPQECSGERWSTWIGALPTTTAVTWSVDGAPAGTGRTYVPTAADAGSSLTCAVSAAYQIPPVPVRVTSLPVTVIPAKVQLITCKVRASSCRTHLVRATFRFAHKSRHATLLKGRKSYSVRVVSHPPRIRILTKVLVPPGRYRLVTGRQVRTVRVG